MVKQNGVVKMNAAGNSEAKSVPPIKLPDGISAKIKEAFDRKVEAENAFTLTINCIVEGFMAGQEPVPEGFSINCDPVHGVIFFTPKPEAAPEA